MKKKYSLNPWFYIIVLFFSCNNKPETANNVLETTIAAHGGKRFYNSHIEFQVDDLFYDLKRKDQRTDFTLRRIRDTTEYIATYKDGYVQYYVNGEEQQTFAEKILNVRLEGFIYTSSIPFVFNQNYVNITKEDDIFIRKEPYTVLHITFTKIKGQPENEFYLYIDKETHQIEFMAENYEYSGEENIFKRFYNKRNINGLLFSDYYSFKAPDNNIPLKDYYKYYDNATLKEFQNIKYTNIRVAYNNTPNDE